jgi:HTH-type transcriptional regulator / antitoxin HipB
MRVRTSRELGALLKEARRKRGMTQQELAKAAGVERSWLTRLEAGRENPTFAKLLAVLDAVGVVLDLQSSGDRPRETPSNRLDAVLAALDPSMHSGTHADVKTDRRRK